MFDLEGELTGFTVIATDEVSLQYDMEGEPKYFKIKANNDVLILCDFDGNWGQFGLLMVAATSISLI
ncbi:hypothetical protein [Pseudoalteromonas sp. ASV78]|uniref:hypothetical protein n=1 Tax=Pseudoalteromonas sp. ASV78 TaxID=3397851 RepID=UPI0039FCB83B